MVVWHLSAASERDDPGSRRKKLWGGSSILFETATMICLFETEVENGAAVYRNVPQFGSKFLR